MVDFNFSLPTIDLSGFNLEDYDPDKSSTTSSTSTSTTTSSSAAAGVQSAAGTGFPGMSDDEVAAMLGMEYTGDRDQDQLVQDAVEQARTENAIATGTYPSQAEIDQRTASFEATMEQLRNDPTMREAWGIDRDTRQFDVGTILRIAAAFAIPAISGAIVNALNLSGTVANVTQATLEAAFSSATGGSPAGSLISSFGGALGDVADAVQTADQAGGLIETVDGLVNFIQQVDEYGRRPEDVIEEVTGEDLSDQEATEEGLDYLDYLQQVREASLGLEPDEDLMGTKDITGDLGESRGIETYFLDALELADFNAGNDVVLSDGTVINSRTHEMTGTPGFGGGQLVTERDVVVEDEGGGAEAAPQPQPETTTTADAGAGDTIFADEPSTGLEVGDGTDVLIEQLQEAIEAETDEATREDLETVLEGLEQAQAEQPEVVEQPQAEVFDPEETTTEAQEEEEEISLTEEIFTRNMPASEMVQVILNDTVAGADTTVETPVETPAAGQEQAGEAGQAGTDTGQVGTGQAGADGGLGGLGGLGMFAGLGEPPGEFTQPEPFKRVSLGYRPVQMERARLFDYMDYNPLRNIR